jgi:rod shape determining protein RodA
MNWYRNFDWILFFSWVALTVFGLVAIYSATQGPVSDFLPAIIQQNFKKQFTFVGIAFIVVIALQFTAPRTFSQAAYFLYGFTILLTLGTLFLGVEINGAKSWIIVGPIRFQISELMKVATILAVANYLSSRRNISMERLGSAVTATLLIVIPGVLVLLQNDTGTALVIFSLTPFLLFWSGLPYGISLFIVSPAIVGYFSVIEWYWGILASFIIVLLIFVIQKRVWLTISSTILNLLIVAGVNVALNNVLQAYQKARIQAFINPQFDPKGWGWNVIQAKTAIGSGGLTGKGFMEGTQTQLRFLPEQWTDFIFCVIGEEFGFVGSVVIVLLFMTLIIRLIYGAGHHKQPFAQSVLVGVASIYLIHFLINTGSALGLLPVIGLPLPFVSYGGSAFLSNSLMLGISLNLLLYKREFSMYI